MRDLTKNELDKLYNSGGCVFCDNQEFELGPCGGAMQNIFCTRCRAGFNVAEPGLGLRIGQLIQSPNGDQAKAPAAQAKPSWWARFLALLR